MSMCSAMSSGTTAPVGCVTPGRNPVLSMDMVSMRSMRCRLVASCSSEISIRNRHAFATGDKLRYLRMVGPTTSDSYSASALYSTPDRCRYRSLTLSIISFTASGTPSLVLMRLNTMAANSFILAREGSRSTYSRPQPREEYRNMLRIDRSPGGFCSSARVSYSTQGRAKTSNCFSMLPHGSTDW